MQIQIAKPNGFSLSAAAAFYATFTPGSGMATADAAHGELTLAFRLDRAFDAVAVGLTETSSAMTLEVAGTTDVEAAARQVTRMLGLDADGDAWHDVGRRDPVVGSIQREFSGFFTAAKPSPYDAATWGVIAPRLAISAAAKIKTAIARVHGDTVTLRGVAHRVFPSPEVLRRLDHVEGLSEEKVARLRAVAEAALEGRLDAERLRAMQEEEALADLQRVRGIGPWTASHVYIRGAAPRDALPIVEPRVVRGWGVAAGITAPTVAAFARAAEAWRPYRAWVAILLARHLQRSGGWNAPGIAKERREAIRRAG